MWSTIASTTINIDETTGCWRWLGYRNKKGYGQIQVGRKSESVHRLMYRLMVGPIPVALTLDHLCFQTDCCNPAHLEPVTRSENTRRLMFDRNGNSKKTHCPQGHPYDEKNTYLRPDGGRSCRACVAAANRRYRAKKKG